MQFYNLSDSSSKYVETKRQTEFTIQINSQEHVNY
jgi:hypothetical protein